MKKNGEKRTSIISGGIRAFMAWIYTMLAGGLIGRFFTTYKKHDRALKEGMIMSAVGGRSRISSVIRKTRFGIAEQFSGSSILRGWKRVIRFLLGCRTRFYGSFTFVFGVYTLLVYMVKRFALDADTSDVSYVYCALLLILISLPLLAGRRSLAYTLLESRAGHFIVTDLLGIPEESLQIPPSKHGESYNIAIIIGLLLGTATYFVNPWLLGILAAIPVAVALILAYPEIGVLLSVFFIPFYGITPLPEGLLVFWVFLFTMAYGIKLICGRRTVKVGFYELLLLIFGVFIFFCGRISLGGERSADVATSMLILLLGSFVAINLMRTETWIKRCGLTVVCSSLIASALVIWQLVVELSLAENGAGLLMFGGSTLPFFTSEDALAAYFVMASMVCVAMLPTVKTARAKLIILTVIAMNICAMAFGLESFSGLIGIAVALLVYSFAVSKKTLPTVLIIGGAVCMVLVFFPSYARELEALMAPVKESIGEKISIWQGGMRIVTASLLAGIGVGAFDKIYPAFAVAGSEGAENSASFLIRLLCDVGLVGTLVFCIVMVLFAKRCFEHISVENDRPSRLFLIGGFCAIIGVLAQSVFFDTWSDLGIFYMFWTVMAITLAHTRQRRAEMDRQANAAQNSESAAAIELVL